jgi:sugar lactone lactonase YvrE
MLLNALVTLILRALQSVGTTNLMFDFSNGQDPVLAITVVGFSYFNMTGNPVKLNGPSDSVVDSKGNLYVTDYYNNGVVKFDSTGAYVATYGKLGSGVGQFNKPSGIAIDELDNLYVADTYNNRIVKFKPGNNNGSIEGWQAWGKAAGNGVLQFTKPMGVYVKGDTIFVADTYNHRVDSFSRLDVTGSLNSWKTFGERGSGNAQFYAPYDLVIDAQGNIIVSDTYNNRIQKFNKDGEFIEQFSADRPYGISIDNSGNVYYAERETALIKCIQNTITYGGKGTTPGLFKSPVGVNVDTDGKLWIVDVTSGIVQWIEP